MGSDNEKRTSDFEAMVGGLSASRPGRLAGGTRGAGDHLGSPPHSRRAGRPTPVVLRGQVPPLVTHAPRVANNDNGCHVGIQRNYLGGVPATLWKALYLKYYNIGTHQALNINLTSYPDRPTAHRLTRNIK